MVKSPRTRHSGAHRDPLTIDLEADAVSRIPDDKDGAAEAVAAEPDAVRAGEADAAAETRTNAPAPGEAEPALPDQQDTPDPAQSNSETERSASSFEAGDDTAAGPAYGTASGEPEFAKAEPRRSGLSAIAAGLIGGAVVLAGGGILQYSGLFGPAGPVAGAPVLDAVNAEIAALRSDVATLRDGAGGNAGAAGLEELGQSLEQVKTEIASLQEALRSGGGGDTTGLDARMKELEAAVAGIGQGANGASQAEIAAINEKIAGLDALANAAQEAGSAVESRLGAIEQSLSTLTAKVDAQTAQPKIALAIAASALKSAIERGAPFQSEIATFAAIVPDTPELAALRVHAESGVASLAEISAEADAAAKAIIAADRPPDPDAGFLERLMDSAGSMVSVRPIGAVEGAGVPETVARMEVAINQGDLAGALAEFDSLPEPAKAAGAPFGEKMRARLEAERLVDQAIAAVMQGA